VLQWVAVWRSVLHCVAVSCSVAEYTHRSKAAVAGSSQTGNRCNTLQHAAAHPVVKEGFLAPCEQATHCNALQRTATHTPRQGSGRWLLARRQLLQHDAMHCNMLQHTHRGRGGVVSSW